MICPPGKSRIFYKKETDKNGASGQTWFFTALWALGKNASYYTTYQRATFWPTALAIPQFICTVLILGVSFNILISVVGSSSTEKNKLCKCETPVKIWLYATPAILLALLILDIWAITFNAVGFRQVNSEGSKELIPGSAGDVDTLVNLISILSIIFNVTVTCKLLEVAANVQALLRNYETCIITTGEYRNKFREMRN